jgi:hypothetical protein
MSAPQVVVPQVVVEKKVRVPTTLPAKYGKFVQFGYYLMNKLNPVDADPLVDETRFIDTLRIYDSLDNQKAFVQEFFDSSKTINQDLRKMVQQRKRDLAKAAKEADKPPKKPRQPRQKKVPLPQEDTVTAEPPKEKKVRAKKLKLPTTEDQLVNDLVQLASQQHLPATIPTSHTDNKKNAANAAVTQLLNNVPTIQDPPKKPRAPPVKKPKQQPTQDQQPTQVQQPQLQQPQVQPTQVNDADDDAEELQVSVFEYNHTTYLIDDNHNVYDFNTQDIIGKFINNSLQLI